MVPGPAAALATPGRWLDTQDLSLSLSQHASIYESPGTPTDTNARSSLRSPACQGPSFFFQKFMIRCILLFEVLPAFKNLLGFPSGAMDASFAFGDLIWNAAAAFVPLTVSSASKGGRNQISRSQKRRPT